MAQPYGIPTTIDTTALSLSLADISKTLTDNVYNSNVLLRKVNEAGNKEMIDGGLSIVKPLIKERQNNGGFYQGADVLNNTQSHTTTQLEMRWQNAYEPIQITRDEERQNSGVEHKIIDLAATKAKLSMMAISRRIEQAISQPVGEAGNLEDLETIVNTGTLGTVNGATDTFWQSTVTASGSFASQGLTDMTTMFYAISGAQQDENPNLIFTNKTIFQKFEQTRLSLERISNGDLSANAGFTNLTFKGVPVVYGNYIQTGLLFELNMNYLKWWVDSITDFTTTEFVQSTNQTAKVAFILLRSALGTDNRRRHGKLTGIT